MGNHISANDFEISKNIIEEDLRRMPISQINWSFDVTPGKNRFDLHWDPYLDRFERVGNRITEPLKKDEQGFLIFFLNQPEKIIKNIIILIS